MSAALAPAAVRFSLATAAPQARGQHPAPQRFARHCDALIGRQMFRRQRRPKALVRLARIVLAHQLENLLTSLVIGSVRSAADVAVHQSFGAARVVTLLEPLRLAVADLQQLGGFGQVQFASFHSAQHFAAPQFLCTHPCPSQSRLLLRSPRLGDISIGRSRGHYHWATTPLNVRFSQKEIACQCKISYLLSHARHPLHRPSSATSPSNVRLGCSKTPLLASPGLPKVLT